MKRIVEIFKEQLPGQFERVVFVFIICGGGAYILWQIARTIVRMIW